MIKEKIYSCAPIWIQNIACSLRGHIEKRKRLGGEFPEILNFLKESEWWDEVKINEYQTNKLKEIVNYCYTNVPYYRKTFDAAGITPHDIQTFDDIKKLPILTKEDVRNHHNELISRSWKGKIMRGHTSGTTGKSLQLAYTPHVIQFIWGLAFRHKGRFGITPTDKYATFTGQTAIPLNQNKPPYWRENRPMRQTVFTMHHISEQKVPSIVKRLNEGEFAYYTGYPSIIYHLASIMEAQQLEIKYPPKAIFTGAESLLKNQRDTISRVFKCPVTDLYGFSEACGSASRCEYDLFHEDFEEGILECHNPTVNEDGSITGEVLATGFTNMAMPFLRYKVGDTATWVETECQCGRKSKTIREVNGRNEDYVITPEGNKILRFDYIFKDTHNIEEAQIVQKELGSIIIRIIKRLGFSVEDEKLLEKEVHNKVSPSLKVFFEYPKEIERERTGKFRAVKSFLNNK